jgi:hypothetical protein
MSKNQLTDAQDLIEEGQYEEARKILKKLKNNATARTMLKELDELSPPTTGASLGRDILHVIAIGLIGTLLFSGVGFGIASALGIRGTGQAAPGPGQTVALNATAAPGAAESATPLPSPTPTEVPCEGQRWWADNGAPLQQTVDALLSTSVQTPPAEVQAAQSRFQAWGNIVNVATYGSPCVAAADSALRAALPEIEAAFSRFLTTSTGAQRAQSLIASMDGLLAVADGIGEMQLGGVETSLTDQISNFTRGECPARRWVTERLLARDYERFFEIFQTLDFNAPAAAQQALIDMRNFSSAFAADDGPRTEGDQTVDPTPECLRPARDSLQVALDGFVAYANNRLGGDIARADQEVTAAQVALANFYAAISALDPALAGIRLGG